MYARAANMFKMAKNWSGKINTLIAYKHCFPLFYVIRYRKLLLFAVSDYPSNYAASLSHCQTLFNFVTFQLQVMPSPRQLFSTCRCRVNMMQPPTSSMLETLSKRQIHKVGPETLTDVLAGYNQDQKNGVRCCLVLWRSRSSAD